MINNTNKITVIPICFFFDHKIVIPAGVCISSLLDKAKSDTFYEIFIFHPGDIVGNYKETLTKLEEVYNNCKFTFLDVRDKFKNGYILRGIPNVTYYRLLVPEMLPQYDKVIVSDVDIIFNIDLSNLYNTVEFEGCYLAAVKNAIVKNNYVRSLGCDPLKYVNCGFFIFNSAQVRQDKISEKFKELVGNKYFYLDQDIINIVCQGKIIYLHPKYNLSQSFYQRYYKDPDGLKKLFSDEEISEGLEASVIHYFKQSTDNSKSGLIHYNGVNPWEILCWRHDIWWEYYRKSIYYDHKFYVDHYNNIINPTAKNLLYRLIKTIMKKYFGKLKRKIIAE